MKNNFSNDEFLISIKRFKIYGAWMDRINKFNENLNIKELTDDEKN